MNCPDCGYLLQPIPTPSPQKKRPLALNLLSEYTMSETRVKVN